MFNPTMVEEMKIKAFGDPLNAWEGEVLVPGNIGIAVSDCGNRVAIVFAAKNGDVFALHDMAFLEAAELEKLLSEAVATIKGKALAN